MSNTRTLITVDSEDFERMAAAVERLEEVVERLLARESAPSPALSKGEAAALLGLSVRSLSSLIDRGELRVVRFGSRVVVPRTEIDRMLSGTPLA